MGTYNLGLGNTYAVVGTVLCCHLGGLMEEWSHLQHLVSGTLAQLPVTHPLESGSEFP